jgi:TRAP transporter TAXI family solute receptor
VQSGGAIENLKTLAAEPKRRKNTLMYVSYIAWYMSCEGISPFTSKYGGARALSTSMNVMTVFSTLDPSIKFGKDLAGKRIGFPPKASIGYLNHQLAMKYAWGVWDKTQKEFLGWSDCITALRDGMVDVAVTNPILAGDKAVANPAILELLSGKKKVNFISITESDLKIIREKSGYPVATSAIAPPFSLGPMQTEPIEGGKDINGWWVDSEFPEDAAYEIVRIIHEYHEEFWSYHASLKGLTPELMSTAANNESEFHPGAVRFYKERGLKMGF